MPAYSVNVEINTNELSPEYNFFRPDVFKSIQCNVDLNLILDHAKTYRCKYNDNASHFDFYQPGEKGDKGTLTFKESHPFFDKFEGIFESDEPTFEGIFESDQPTNGTIFYKDHPRYLKFEGDVHPNTCNPKTGKLVYIEAHKTILHFQGDFDENGDLVKGEITFKPEYSKKTFQGEIKDRSFQSGTLIYNDCHPKFYERFTGSYLNGEPHKGELVFNKNHPHYFSVKCVNEKDMFNKDGDIKYGRVFLKSFPNQPMESFNTKNFYYWEGPLENGYPIGQGTFGFVFKDETIDEDDDEDSLLRDAQEVSGFFDKNTMFKSLNGKLSARNTEKFWELKQKLDKHLLLPNLLENVSSNERKRHQCDDDNTQEEEVVKRRKTDGDGLAFNPRKTHENTTPDNPKDYIKGRDNAVDADPLEFNLPNEQLNMTSLFGYE
jgi:hypothetical protein